MSEKPHGVTIIIDKIVRIFDCFCEIGSIGICAVIVIFFVYLQGIGFVHLITGR